MQNYEIWLLIKRKLGIITLVGVFLAAISFLFVVVSQPNFKAGMHFLIVQDKDGNQDYYSISKSAEYIGKVFGEAIYSDLFIEEVIKTGKVSKEFLPFDRKARLEKWSKIVKVGRNPEVSMMNVFVFADNRDEAVKISQGISEVLETKSYLFRGSGVNVDVRVLSGPIIEKNPNLNQIIMVIIGGFLLGSLLSAVWIFYRYSPEREYKKMINLAKKRENYFGDPGIDEYEESLKYLDKD